MADYSPPPLPNAAPAKMSGLAVTSLVLAVLGLFSCGLTALFGLALGIIALVKVKNSQGRLTGSGLAIAGIVVSAIFLVLLPVFAAMLLPALAAAKGRAQEIVCINNEKQLGMAIQLYETDNSNHFPPAATWCDAIKSKVGNDSFFKCPAVNPDSQCDFAFNAALDGLDKSQVDPQTVMLFESDGGWNAHGGSELMIGHSRNRYGHRFIVTLADGAVIQEREADLNRLRWNP